MLSKPFAEKSKLAIILEERNMSQTDLHLLIFEKTGKTIGRDRISRMVNNRIKHLTLTTAKLVSKTLELPIDEIF